MNTVLFSRPLGVKSKSRTDNAITLSFSSQVQMRFIFLCCVTDGSLNTYHKGEMATINATILSHPAVRWFISPTSHWRIKIQKCKK